MELHAVKPSTHQPDAQPHHPRTITRDRRNHHACLVTVTSSTTNRCSSITRDVRGIPITQSRATPHSITGGGEASWGTDATIHHPVRLQARHTPSQTHHITASCNVCSCDSDLVRTHTAGNGAPARRRPAHHVTLSLAEQLVTRTAVRCINGATSNTINNQPSKRAVSCSVRVYSCKCVPDAAARHSLWPGCVYVAKHASAREPTSRTSR